MIEGTIIPNTYTFNVESDPESGVPITVNPNDNNAPGDGNTNFSRTYEAGTEVTLAAPTFYNGRNFIKWTVDSNEWSNPAITITMDSNHTAQAVYKAATYTLTVQSSPDTGVPITITPQDNNNAGNGSTEFSRTYDFETVVNLTAPVSTTGEISSTG